MSKLYAIVGNRKAAKHLLSLATMQDEKYRQWALNDLAFSSLQETLELEQLEETEEYESQSKPEKILH